MATQRKPEWSFQAWLHRYLEAVVLEPKDIRGFDISSAAMASAPTRFAAMARGCKPGTPDHWVFQGDRVVVAMECKAGRGVATDAQKATANALERCGITVVRECRTISDALDGLRRAGARVQENAELLAVVYQEHVDAALREIIASGGRKRAPGRARTTKAPASRIAQAHRAGLWDRP